MDRLPPAWRGCARPANVTVTWVARGDERVYTMELYSVVPAAAPATATPMTGARHVGVAPDGAVHVFCDGLVPNWASWGKYPREFVAGVDYMGRHVVLDMVTGKAIEVVYDEFIKQKHHNFMYQHRVKRFTFPLGAGEAAHPDTQTYVAPLLWEELGGMVMGGADEAGAGADKADNVLTGRVHTFDKQRTVNNTFTYIDKHVHHGLVFLQKYKKYGTAMLPSVYVGRHKQDDVGEKLKQLFVKHAHTQLRGVAIVSDHWSGGSLVVMNAIGF